MYRFFRRFSTTGLTIYHPSKSITDIPSFTPSPTPKAFRFLPAAAGKAKGIDIAVIPVALAPYHSVQVGEDSFFMRSDGMGVADGIGGWKDKELERERLHLSTERADAALYALKIMHYVTCQLEQYDELDDRSEDGHTFNLEDYGKVSPQSILRNSYECTNADAREECFIGSTTALVAVLRGDEMRVANIGDCAFMLIRKGITIYRSEEQQHSFNFPYQLGTTSRNTPEDTQTMTLKIKEGDVVIMGSDGLFDNVFDDDIVDIVASKTKSNVILSNPQDVADALLRKAKEVAEDSRFATSPFQNKALQEGIYYQGGKVDDITVIVGVIRLNEDSPDRR